MLDAMAQLVTRIDAERRDEICTALRALADC
jgi:hypothetical protein